MVADPSWDRPGRAFPAPDGLPVRYESGRKTTRPLNSSGTAAFGDEFEVFDAASDADSLLGAEHDA